MMFERYMFAMQTSLLDVHMAAAINEAFQQGRGLSLHCLNQFICMQALQAFVSNG